MDAPQRGRGGAGEVRGWGTLPYLGRPNPQSMTLITPRGSRSGPSRAL